MMMNNNESTKKIRKNIVHVNLKSLFIYMYIYIYKIVEMVLGYNIYTQLIRC